MISFSEKDIKETINELQKKGIKLIRILYIDLDNVIRGKILTLEQFEKEAMEGETLSIVMESAFTVTDELVTSSQYSACGEVRFVPDITTVRPITWAPGQGMVIGEQYTDNGKPFEVDPRPKLREMIKRSKYDFLVGFEPEFYLFRKEGSNLETLDKSLCFATSGMNTTIEFVNKLKDALDALDIKIGHYYPEYGPGQQEVPLHPYDPVRAADSIIMFREAVRGVAHSMGLIASFMPKPSKELPGSGLHLHISLWENGENVFYSENDRYNLSDEGYWFIGGILKHLPALMAFTAPTVNSYKRLQPSQWASAFACWGARNREAAIRIPLAPIGKEKEFMHFELKFADNTLQPYLAVGSIIAAGLEGIDKKIEPPEPCLTDPATLSSAEREEKGWYRYPENLLDALRALEKDRFFRDVWGDTLIEEYLKLKLYQWNSYYNHVSDWEREKLFDVF